MSFCKSDQKSMPVVGFLTCNGSGMFCRPKLGYIGALDTRLISRLHRPLHTLTQKSKDWSWGAAEQQAFDALKSTITSAPMLTFPSKSGPFHLECDASNFAMGAVLLQQQEDGLFHLIGFMSKSFSNMERNYQIHNKEILAIMHALEEC